MLNVILAAAVTGSELTGVETRKARAGFATVDVGADGAEVRFGKYFPGDFAVEAGFRNDGGDDRRAMEALAHGRKYFGESFFEEVGVGFGFERDESRRFYVVDFVIGNEWVFAEHLILGANWLGLSTRKPGETAMRFRARLPSMSLGVTF